jgi:hypothetical protein
MVTKETSGLWPRIRYQYEETGKTVEQIALENRVSAGTIRDRMRRWSWTRRRAPIPCDGPPSLPPPAENAARAPAALQIEPVLAPAAPTVCAAESRG